MSKRTQLVELGMVGLTAAVFLLIPKPPTTVIGLAIFIPTCIVGWTSYGVFRALRDREQLSRWGLRPTRHARPLALILGPILVVAVAAGASYATWLGRPLVAEHLLLSLLLYPLWGLVQQWIVQCLLVDNVRKLTGAGLPWLMVLGAVGFGAIHLAHPPLVIATACMGALYVYLYQRWPNLWPLALCHGWLGSLFYPWVLDINPIAQAVAAIGG